jgi:hypothetical protein
LNIHRPHLAFGDWYLPAASLELGCIDFLLHSGTTTEPRDSHLNDQNTTGATMLKDLSVFWSLYSDQ